MTQRASKARLILGAIVMAACAVALTTLARGETADDSSKVSSRSAQSAANSGPIREQLVSDQALSGSKYRFLV